MDVKSILGLTACLLVIGAIVGLVVNFICELRQREYFGHIEWPWISLNTSDIATENTTSQNFDDHWANDKINLSDGKG